MYNMPDKIEFVKQVIVGASYQVDDSVSFRGMTVSFKKKDGCAYDLFHNHS